MSFGVQNPQAGRPAVSVVKIDVEGAELNVLNGATKLLESCRPHLMMEANTRDELRVIEDFLAPYGYSRSRPVGFMPWNYLFRSQQPQQIGDSAYTSVN